MYATQADMTNRFGEQEIIQLTDRDGSAGTVVGTVLDRAIADATAEIDSYVAARYAVPLQTVPATLTRVACDLARYYLYDDQVPEAVRQRYEAAVRLLRGVAKGEVTLGPGDSGGEAKTVGGAEVTSGGRIFGRGQGGFL